MPEDDRAVMKRLAALEAEVKADADAAGARKRAALERAREQREAQQREREALRPQQTALVKRQRAASPELDRDDRSDLGGALELARKADDVRQELAKKGAKSWVTSGLASLLLGPLGWLYAGSLREAVPASIAYLLLAAIAGSVIPTFLLMPVMMVALPLSGIAGVVYALQYNRHGARQRLFDRDKSDDEPKQLGRGE